MTINKINYPLATETWDDTELAAIDRVVKSRRFTMGPEVKAFEEKFARQFGSKYAVMVNSGSSANLLAIAALVYHPDKLLKAGDEVIVPAVSWSTTYYPVTQLGLKLSFVDIDAETLNLDIDKVEAAITPATRAIFAVNLLGNPNDFTRLKEICSKHNLLLIEDNCESMGATFEGKQAGTFGVMGTYSTFFSHHIATMEGGVIVTDSEVLYHTLLSLRAHGWLREQPAHSHLQIEADEFTRLFRFVLPGYNVRPIEMEGAIGQSQLDKLPGMVESRRQNAGTFKALFGNIEGIRIQKEVGQSSWFGFSLVLEGGLAGQRAGLVERLRAAAVDCRPIVAGNFLKNPVIAHLPHIIGSEIVAAEEIDQNGLFLGNHHYDITSQLEATAELVRSYAAQFARVAA